jgi:hypothetical protein
MAEQVEGAWRAARMIQELLRHERENNNMFREIASHLVALEDHLGRGVSVGLYKDDRSGPYVLPQSNQCSVRVSPIIEILVTYEGKVSITINRVTTHHAWGNTGDEVKDFIRERLSVPL